MRGEDVEAQGLADMEGWRKERGRAVALHKMNAAGRAAQVRLLTRVLGMTSTSRAGPIPRLMSTSFLATYSQISPAYTALPRFGE